MLNAAQDLVIHFLSFAFVLGMVVFVHEFGHFQVARWCGIAIEAFSIGFGQKLAGWTDKQGVVWRIGALPIGGYVKFVGDTDPSSTVGAPAPTDPAALEAARKRGLFHAQPIWARAAVAVAGPVSNFLFAILVFALLLMAFGRDVTDVRTLTPRIGAVQEGSAAAAAGLQKGDVIVAIDGLRVANFGVLQTLVSERGGKPMRVLVRRDEQAVTLTATPRELSLTDQQGVEHKRGVLGVSPALLPSDRKIERLGPIQAVGAGAGQVWEIVTSTFGYLGNIFTGKASADHIAGPLGIFSMSGDVAKGAVTQGPTLGERLGNLIAGLIAWAATLSVAVGIVNMLPVPILDGGHLLFYGIEALRGRPLDQKAQTLGLQLGMALIGSLFLFATWNDLQRLKPLEFLTRILS